MNKSKKNKTSEVNTERIYLRSIKLLSDRTLPLKLTNVYIAANTLEPVSKIEQVYLNSRPNMRLTLNAKKYVLNEVGLAIENGIITKKDIIIASAAIVAVGIENAQKYGQTTIKASDIQKGWQIHKKPGFNALGIGNCPPHRCVLKTVISRVDEFSEDVPVFNILKK